MTTAFVFPGQGSQSPGMGAPFRSEWPATRAAFEEMDAAVEFDLRELCFDADAGTLASTECTQPAVYATGVAALRGVRAAFDAAPAYVAGHSLGQFTAAAAAGALDPVEGVGVVRERGRLMEAAAAEAGPGEMVAVLLADPDYVREATAAVDGASVASFNAPRQTVVSGTGAAVADVRERLEAATRCRFAELDVGAAFHSPVMEPAVEPFGSVLEATVFAEPDVPIVSDVTGNAHAGAAEMREALTEQLTSPVRWVDVVETLRAAGVDRYVEFPPAGTLATLIERIDPEASVHAVDSPADAGEVFGR